jgi:hypothetical protein
MKKYRDDKKLNQCFIGGRFLSLADVILLSLSLSLSYPYPG